MIDTLQIINRFYTTGSELHSLLVAHSEDVTRLALRLGERAASRGMDLDLEFVGEAAMLHDIGIFLTDAPGIHCHGDKPYICHGIIGRQLLDDIGLKKHALVCERHTGAGITIDDIKSRQLPLPPRDFLPLSLEEKLICYADKFFSKTRIGQQKSIEQARKSLMKFGQATLQRFEELHQIFGLDSHSDAST